MLSFNGSNIHLIMVSLRLDTLLFGRCFAGGWSALIESVSLEDHFCSCFISLLHINSHPPDKSNFTWELMLNYVAIETEWETDGEDCRFTPDVKNNFLLRNDTLVYFVWKTHEKNWSTTELCITLEKCAALISRELFSDLLISFQCGICQGWFCKGE